MSETIIEISNLDVNFKTDTGDEQVLYDVNVAVKRGEVLAIVGESGSGKSVTTKSLLGLLPENARVKNGVITYENQDLLTLSEKALQQIRGKKIAMIFQEPFASLDPTRKIGKQVSEVLSNHQLASKKEAKAKVIDLLEKVGVPNPSVRYHSYPHEFSGGQLQRISIAAALIAKPEILIADEPTTALDVTVQAKILDLIIAEKEQLGLTIIFITHDLAVVSQIADRIVIMRDGKVLEVGGKNDIFKHPQHPYTKSLVTIANRANLDKNQPLPVLDGGVG
jgi:oligopeptide transport system ATP-binding protein